MIDQPWVRQYLWDANSFFRIEYEHTVNKVFAFNAEDAFHLGRVLERATSDDLMKVMHILGFEGHSATEHCIEEYSHGPDISTESFVTIV